MTAATTSRRILVVDDEAKIRTILAAILDEQGYEVRTASDGISALEIARTFRPHLLIVDYQMPRMDGIETIVRVKEFAPGSVAIMLTAHGSIQSAVQAIKEGAYDYLTKPFDNDQLLIVVKRALQLSHMTEKIDELTHRLRGSQGVQSIIGESDPMQQLRAQIMRIAPTDVTVLIEGESGTGKELAARAIHFESARAGNPLVTIDCSAIPSALVESTFFGHEAGAFTDAREQRVGKFQAADGGTVFLDEIGELSLDAQAKLLRVLQEREFTRVGGTAPVRVDVRVIAATNKNLAQEVREGRFREDLYYRLNVLTLHIPPLRDHKSDIQQYARFFLEKHHASIGGKARGITDAALELLKQREWRGNIREIENTIQRAMLHTSGEMLDESAFLPSPGETLSLVQSYDPSIGLEEHVKHLAEQAERQIITSELDATNWNRTETASRLKISRKTLFNKMRQYGFEDDPPRE
jgi:DNA-binding NtrC family response regulator